MKYRRDLQVQLQERYRRLYKSDYQVFATNVTVFVNWLAGVPALAGIVAAIDRSNQDLDIDEWWDQAKTRSVKWFPDTEEERAKIVLKLLRTVAYDSEDWTRPLTRLMNETNYTDAARAFCDQWLEPVVEYLQNHLASESDMLYLLERYKYEVEWFEQLRLFEAYEADTRRGESTYDADLRRYLFREGMDYPFSQPQGPSGKADIVAGLDTDDPLTCEIKLYDGKSYTKAYIGKGVHQAVRYAQDYGKTSAYLVVVNLTDKSLEFPSDDSEAGWPPRIEVSGITVFIIVIQGKPRLPASKSGKTIRTRFSRTDMVTDL